MITAGLWHQLLSGVRPLLSVLCSSAAGVRLLLGDAAVAARLLQGLDPAALPAETLEALDGRAEEPAAAPGAAADGSGGAQPAVDAAAVLHDTLLAHAAAADLAAAPIGTPAFAAAVCTLCRAVHGGSGGNAARQTTLLAMAVHSAQVVPRLLGMLCMHCQLLRLSLPAPPGSAGDPAGQQGTPVGGSGDGPGWRSPGSGLGGPFSAAAAAPDTSAPRLLELLQSAAECAEAAGLLEALLGEDHPDVLGRWAPGEAEAVRAAVGEELGQLPAKGLPERECRKGVAGWRIVWSSV